MTLTLYGIKNCDTVRKALKDLESAGKDVDFIDVRKDGLTAQTVSGWLKDCDAETLINTRGTTWRGMSDAEKKAAMADPSKAIEANPTLFKRPVIVDAGGGVSVGWKKDAQDKRLT